MTQAQTTGMWQTTVTNITIIINIYTNQYHLSILSSLSSPPARNNNNLPWRPADPSHSPLRSNLYLPPPPPPRGSHVKTPVYNLLASRNRIIGGHVAWLSRAEDGIIYPSTCLSAGDSLSFHLPPFTNPAPWKHNRVRDISNRGT